MTKGAPFADLLTACRTFFYVLSDLSLLYLFLCNNFMTVSNARTSVRTATGRRMTRISRDDATVRNTNTDKPNANVRAER
jgi:hypothetical protein